MIRLALATTLLVSCAGLAAAADDKATSSAPSGQDRVFELRKYYANEGKGEALHKRFRDHTCELFKKHGMDLIGFWTPREEKDGKSDVLIYILAFPSKEAADKSWKAFREDPEWKRVSGESEKNGKLVKKVESVYLNPTDYSLVK